MSCAYCGQQPVAGRACACREKSQAPIRRSAHFSDVRFHRERWFFVRANDVALQDQFRGEPYSIRVPIGNISCDPYAQTQPSTRLLTPSPRPRSTPPIFRAGGGLRSLRRQPVVTPSGRIQLDYPWIETYVRRCCVCSCAHNTKARAWLRNCRPCRPGPFVNGSRNGNGNGMAASRSALRCCNRGRPSRRKNSTAGGSTRCSRATPSSSGTTRTRSSTTSSTSGSTRCSSPRSGSSASLARPQWPAPVRPHVVCAHVCVEARALLRWDGRTSAPGLGSICAGTVPHLR